MTADLEIFCERQLTRLREAGVLAHFDAGPGDMRAALPRVVAASDFVCEALLRDANLAKWLIGEGELARTLDAAAMAARLGSAVGAAQDAATFMTALRRQRQREMARIAWRRVISKPSMAARAMRPARRSR